MAKKRVHEIAKERGLTSKEVLAKLQAAGIEVKAAASSVEEDVAAKALDGAAPAAAPKGPRPPNPSRQRRSEAAPKAEAKPAAAAPARPPSPFVPSAQLATVPLRLPARPAASVAAW